MTKHLIIGDGHYVDNPPQQKQWKSLVDHACAEGCNEISILGDFFELWIGIKGLEDPWQDKFFAPLRRAAEQGVRLRYVMGNKDYFIRQWNKRHQLFHEVCENSLRLESPQGPIVLAHGDLVNLKDRQYRLWRSFSRSLIFSVMIRLLPKKWIRALGDKTATAMQSTNTRHKSYFPKSQLERCAANQRGPATIMIYGHFHTHTDFFHGAHRIITLPFLGAENTGIWIDEEGIKLFGPEI